MSQSSRHIITSLLITLGGALFTYAVHQPRIGMDDANITQVYGGNIAAGHGFVYNRGGERVEGSTSMAWTLLNSVAFLVSDQPEWLLTAFALFLAFLTALEAMRLARLLHDHLQLPPGYEVIGCAVGFLMWPAFFTWSVWSLMDTGLWIYCATAAATGLAMTVTADRSSAVPSTKLIAAAIALPLVRPEGMLLSSVVLAMASFAVRGSPSGRRRAVVAWVLWLGTVGGATAFRLMYFGVPVPNTFYAKVSTGLVDQARAGTAYVVGYFSQPEVILLTLAALVTVLVLLPRSVWLAWLFVVFSGTTEVTYAAVGGDHFGFFRQMQVLAPLTIAFASPIFTRLLLAWQPRARSLHGTGPRVLHQVVQFAVISLIVAPPLMGYVRDYERVDYEFRIAESGRLVGERLQELERRPSVAVISSGGIARTYTGHIYDLMGLNWSEMAHAVSDKSGGVRSHASFSPEVFYRALPDIVLPGVRACTTPAGFEYFNLLLKGLLDEPRFVAEYEYVCYQDLTFFARRSTRDPRYRTFTSSTP